MFMIVFMAYAQFGYLLFGPKLYDFSKMSYSAYTLMRTMLGDFDFPAFQVDHLGDENLELLFCLFGFDICLIQLEMKINTVK